MINDPNEANYSLWNLKNAFENGFDEGDCAVHYFGAQQLAFNGFLNDNNARYEAIFIQLYSYTFILSVFVN